jgi:preprotein translocase subunit SecE
LIGLNYPPAKRLRDTIIILTLVVAAAFLLGAIDWLLP